MLRKRARVLVFNRQGVEVIDHALACVSRRRFPVNDKQPVWRNRENPRGNEGERVSSGHSRIAASEPELGGFTERVNGSENRDNETEWTDGP